MSEGLRTLNDKNATELANKWTQRWTLSNYIAFKETKVMFEKVDSLLHYFNTDRDLRFNMYKHDMI